MQGSVDPDRDPAQSLPTITYLNMQGYRKLPLRPVESESAHAFQTPVAAGPPPPKSEFHPRSVPPLVYSSAGRLARPFETRTLASSRSVLTGAGAAT